MKPGKANGSCSPFTNSVVRALSILESFTLKDQNLSFPQIHRMTNIPRSSVFRLLRTLSELNYLRYNRENKKYSLGARVLSLGFSVLQSMEIREITRPYLEKLSREFNKSVNLLMLDRLRMVFIERIRVPGVRDFHISIGSTVPVYNTAAGKVVLAYLPQDKVAGIIEGIKKDPQGRRHIGRDGKDLLQALKEVRRDAFAIYNEEASKGMRAIAVPIFSSKGVECAMDMVVAAEEISVDELKTGYAPRLVRAGNEISEVLGWLGRSERTPRYGNSREQALGTK
jgi:IclR family transcriptional regulator, pca regulon regulatory protein